jgi:FixJ family two-component response regulator
MTAGTVFIVDDDEAVRRGIAFLLRAAGHEIEPFASAAAFLGGYEPEQRGCLLLDVRMPEMSGLELQQALAARGWQIPTIFITGHATVPMAIAAMKAGAFDFIEKPLRDEALIESVERALAWSRTRHHEHQQLVDIQARAGLLTEREREILKHVVAGEPNKVIARRLGISFRTVELHRSHILEKMQARTLAELIRLALLLEQQRRN